MTEQPMSREEVRFAVVLNGGVSLAVWMGGVVLELDRLTRAGTTYQPLLDLVGCTARADVIAGTSAGGINGAALALSQVNKQADLSRLRDLWAEQGRMEQLLRTPFRGEPASLLKGDEFFLPRLQEALARLTGDFEPTEPNERPIDLRITTTLLGGVPNVTYDDLGQPLTQSVHQGSFSFRRDPYDWVAEETRDDFTADALNERVMQLALAARSSASFPFAFEPSFIPVGGQASPDRPALAFQSERTPLRFVSWSELEASVAATASGLRRLGVRRGDRVVAVIPNMPEAVVALLACASIGAIWASCSPEFGTRSLIDRFKNGNWFEDPSNNSIACRQTGPIEIGNIDMSKDGSEVFRQGMSLIWKTLAVNRIYDKTNNTLIYLAHSRQVTDGSAKMSISTIPLYGQDVVWKNGKP